MRFFRRFCKGLAGCRWPIGHTKMTNIKLPADIKQALADASAAVQAAQAKRDAEQARIDLLTASIKAAGDAENALNRALESGDAVGLNDIDDRLLEQANRVGLLAKKAAISRGMLAAAEAGLQLAEGELRDAKEIKADALNQAMIAAREPLLQKYNDLKGQILEVMAHLEGLSQASQELTKYSVPVPEDLAISGRKLPGDGQWHNGERHQAPLTAVIDRRVVDEAKDSWLRFGASLVG